MTVYAATDVGHGEGCVPRYTPSQAGPSYEYTDNAHDVYMMHYVTEGGEIPRIYVKITRDGAVIP